MNGHNFEDRGWKGQVEQPVGAGVSILVSLDELVELCKILLGVVGTGDVVIESPEFLVTLLLAGLYLHVLLAFFAQRFDREVAPGVAVEARRCWDKVVAEQPPERWVDLLLGQVAL